MVYEDIEENKRNTFMLIFIFTLLIMVLGYVVGEIYGNAYYGVGIAALIAFFSIGNSYYNSHKIVIALTGAQPANRKIHRSFYNAVEGMALAAGLPQPKAYVLKDERINAFAAGRDPRNAVIAVTEGALRKLDKYELEGVVAHEMSHIKNYDILVGSVSAVLVGTIIVLSDIITRSSYRRDMRRGAGRKGWFFIIIAILTAILAPIAAQIINMSISRQREYMADARAVLLTRYPKGLIGALEKIKADVYKKGEISKGFQHMYLNVPSRLKDESLWSSHPPVDRRITRLKKM